MIISLNFLDHSVILRWRERLLVCFKRDDLVSFVARTSTLVNMVVASCRVGHQVLLLDGSTLDHW